jgi:hypothetical protein
MIEGIKEALLKEPLPTIIGQEDTKEKVIASVLPPLFDRKRLCLSL